MTDQLKDDTRSNFEPTDRIEQFLIGLIAFVRDFLRTLRDIAVNKKRFSLVLKGQDTDIKYTKPVTFITLISFVAIRIFRFGLLTLLLASGTSSCQAETWTESTYPSLWDELKVPSITEIILYGIPILITVLLISQFLKFVLLNGQTDSGTILANITYYTVGFQYISYLILFSLVSFLIYLEPPEWFAYLIPVMVLLFFLWPVLVFHRLASKVIGEDQFRVRNKGWKQIWLFLWSLILIVVTILVGWGFSYSLAQLEIDERIAKPYLRISLIGYDNSFVDRFSIDMLVRNNSDDEFALKTDHVRTFGNLQHDGGITRNCQGETPVVILRPNDICWMTLVFLKEGPEYNPSPFSTSLRNIIEFSAIYPEKDAQSINAYIRIGEASFDISQLE